MTYAGLLKKSEKVSALKEKRAENANKQHRAKSAEPQPVAMHSGNGKPTIAEKLAADSGRTGARQINSERGTSYY
jgi:hypothetical protein